MDINGPPGRVSTNASEHAMLRNMFFAPPSQNTKSVWCMLKHWNNHHGHALQCTGCVAWAGDVYHVIISMSKWVDSFLTCSSCNLFFSFCERVQSCLNLKAPNHWQVNYCHIAPVTCQAAATTVSVVPGMTFSSASIFSSSLGKYGKVLLGQAKLLFQNLWSWFKRLTCSDLSHSEYLIPLSQIVLTCSDLSHSPEDAVILIILRRMSLSTPVFSWTYIWLSWTYIIAAFTDIRHSPSTNTLTNLHKSHWKSSVLFLKDIAGYLKKTLPGTVTEGPIDPVWVHRCHNVVF